MGLKIETWALAFRNRKNGLILNDNSEFTLIKSKKKGWFADPFLFDNNGDTYLFAEFFSYKLSRGVIAYSKYDKKKAVFEEFKEIITEDYHLSYPFVFDYNGNIYMMPESNESNSLYLYKAVDFPDRWEKLPPIIEKMKLVDTTPVFIGEKKYALSLRIDSNNTENKNELLLLDFSSNDFKVNNIKNLKTDMSTARPGGRFFKFNNRFYRVSQDCIDEYGKAINILEIDSNYFCNFKESLVKKITPKQINLVNAKQSEGIHTYNFSDKFEVIDLKYYKYSFIRIIYKLLLLIKRK